MRELITLVESRDKQQDIEIVDLKYKEGDLAPTMSRDTIKLHWGKLAHAYAERFNKHEGDREFNYAGAMLHNFFFAQFRESRNKNEPNGPIGNLIRSRFKSWDNFKDKFLEECLKLQGSGWIYLARDGSIKTIHNHEVHDDILLLVDMWEHAYILDYGSDKTKYIDNIWRLFDWNVINSIYMRPYNK